MKRKILVIGIIGIFMLINMTALSVSHEQKTNDKIMATLNDVNVVDFGEIIHTEIIYKEFLGLRIPFLDISVDKADIIVGGIDPNCKDCVIKMSVEPFDGCKLFYIPLNQIKVFANVICSPDENFFRLTSFRDQTLVGSKSEVLSFEGQLDYIYDPDDPMPDLTIELTVFVNAFFISPVLKIPYRFLFDPNVENNEATCIFTLGWK